MQKWKMCKKCTGGICSNLEQVELSEKTELLQKFNSSLSGGVVAKNATSEIDQIVMRVVGNPDILGVVKKSFATEECAKNAHCNYPILLQIRAMIVFALMISKERRWEVKS